MNPVQDWKGASMGANASLFNVWQAVLAQVTGLIKPEWSQRMYLD
jgi:hypothetical protein